MSRTTRHATGVLLLVVGLIASAALVLLQAPAADAASRGRVRGYVVAPHDEHVPLRMAWFTSDWRYLGSKSVSGNGAFDLTLPVGSYRLQFTDKRPSYDVTKFAPTDATVTVRSGSTAVRNVRMHRGAAITGTVRTPDGRGSHATVTAANKAEQSFSTIANDKGQFAIGGLPAGSYSVFTYDHKKTYVAKSTYVKKLAAGHPQNVDIKLNKRAGNLLVDLYAGDRPVSGTLTVTAISKKTGQFWTLKARNGTAALKGVYPGRYTLIVPGYRDFFGKTGTVSRGKVSPGRTAFGSFRLTDRGGAFTGRLVSQDVVPKAIASATVRLYDATGAVVAEATTAADGSFRVGGRLGNIASLTLVAFDSKKAYDDLKISGLKSQVNQTKDLGDLELEPVLVPSASPSASPTASSSPSSSASPTTSPSTSASASATPTATPTPVTSVAGSVVDASNTAIHLADAVVQLVDIDGVKLAETTSGSSGGFRLTPKLSIDHYGYVSIVVQPGPYTDYMGTDTQRCQYRWTLNSNVQPGTTGDVGAVGLARKDGGNCRAPVGTPVGH